jgi:hypothetical protein
MTKGFEIGKERLNEALTFISSTSNVELKGLMLNEIKYGMVGTSEQKSNRFGYGSGRISVRVAVNSEDDDIVHFQITGLDNESIERLIDIRNKNSEFG